MIRIGGVYCILLSAKRRAYFCKRVAIQMGGVSRYFSKVSGSGVDLPLLNPFATPAATERGRICKIAPKWSRESATGHWGSDAKISDSSAYPGRHRCERFILDFCTRAPKRPVALSPDNFGDISWIWHLPMAAVQTNRL